MNSTTADTRSTVSKLFMMVVSVCAVVPAVVLLGRPAETPRTAAESRPVAADDVALGDHLPLNEPGEPCPMAIHGDTIQDLNADVPIWAPADERPTDAWTCGGTPVLWYGDVQIDYESGWSGVDVDRKWTDMAKSDGGSVKEVLGRTAYVHPADDRGPRNGIAVVIGDVLIGITARPGVPIERLLQLANSIQLPKELQKA